MLGIDPLVILRGGLLLVALLLTIIAGRQRYSFPVRCSFALGALAGLMSLISLTLGQEEEAALFLVAASVGFLAVNLTSKSS